MTSLPTIDVDATLAQLVVEDRRRAPVLESFGLDYCCHGHRSLAQASAEAAVDLDAVRRALVLPPADPAATTDAADRGAPRAHAALAHDIVDTHHAYMWAEMPRLEALVEKVHRVHGERHPELDRVRELFAAALAALEPHMTTEERVVFPAISRLERSGGTDAPGRLAAQIGELVDEHAVVGELFRQLGTATGGYAAPPDACGSYRAMLDGLREMERDLHEHIHQENNVLFPAVLDLERSLAAGA